VPLTSYCIMILLVLLITEQINDDDDDDAFCEGASNDVTEHPRDDMPGAYLCTVCDKRFVTEIAFSIQLLQPHPQHVFLHSL